MMRQAVCPAIELAIGDVRVADNQRRPRRIAPRMAGNRLVHERLGRPWTRSAVAHFGETKIARRHRIDATDQCLGISHQRGEKALELRHDLLGLRGVEMAHQVCELDLQPLVDQYRQIHGIVRHVDIAEVAEPQ